MFGSRVCRGATGSGSVSIPSGGLFSKAVGVGQSGGRTKPLVLHTHYPPTGTAVSGTSVITPGSGGSRLVWNVVDA